jgi:hypothetical protein
MREMLQVAYTFICETVIGLLYVICVRAWNALVDRWRCRVCVFHLRKLLDELRLYLVLGLYIKSLVNIAYSIVSVKYNTYFRWNTPNTKKFISLHIRVRVPLRPAICISVITNYIHVASELQVVDFYTF